MICDNQFYITLTQTQMHARNTCYIRFGYTCVFKIMCLKNVMAVQNPLSSSTSPIDRVNCPPTGTECGWPFLLGGFVVLAVLAVLAHPLLPESPTYCYAVAQDEARGLKGDWHMLFFSVKLHKPKIT